MIATALMASQAVGNDWQILKELFARADKEGRVAASMREIAEACRIHHDTVKRAIKRLIRTGELRRFSRAGARGCNAYQLTKIAPVSPGRPTGASNIHNGIIAHNAPLYQGVSA